MRFYDLCGIMPGRPAKLIVNLCEQPGCSLPSPLHLTHCLAEEEKEASRGIERVQRLRFRSQQLSLSSLNFNGKAKFFQLSFHTLPLCLSLVLSFFLCLWSRRPHVLATIFLTVGNCCCGPCSCCCCCYCCSG